MFLLLMPIFAAPWEALAAFRESAAAQRGPRANGSVHGRRRADVLFDGALARGQGRVGVR